MLPSNTAADDTAVNQSTVNAVNGATELNGVNDVNGSAETCYTPVTDPDSIALLAAMHEANRFGAHLCHMLVLLVV